MTDEYDFHVVDAAPDVHTVSDGIKQLLEPMLAPTSASYASS
jgi:hypothetical protein